MYNCLEVEEGVKLKEVWTLHWMKKWAQTGGFLTS